MINLFVDLAAGKITRDGRRISATCAMRADAFYKRRGQKQFCPPVKKYVHRIAHTTQMAAFDKRGAAKTRVNFAGGGAHAFSGRNFASGQDSGFM